jgi:hypothetical protein
LSRDNLQGTTRSQITLSSPQKLITSKNRTGIQSSFVSQILQGLQSIAGIGGYVSEMGTRPVRGLQKSGSRIHISTFISHDGPRMGVGAIVSNAGRILLKEKRRYKSAG